MSAMLALISAGRNAATRGARTHVPVGLVTVSDMMVAPAMVLSVTFLNFVHHGRKYFFSSRY